MKDQSRNFRIAVSSLALPVILLAPALVQAAPLPIPRLFGTGVDANGVLLADETVDPHWVVGASTDVGNPGPALYAFPDGTYPLVPGTWAANTTTGRWVTLQPTDPDTANGAVFSFDTTIDLRGRSTVGASITIELAADDDYVIFLNGANTGVQRSGSYSALASHTISAGFVAGLNTLRITVNNSGGGPTGLFVSQLSGTAEPDTADPDNDGSSNYIEHLAGTDPNNPDTDGDGIKDGAEDRNHNGIVDPGESDPKKADTDGDGIPDGVEDKNKNGIVDPGETDPTKADTDGDGISDGVEDKNKNGVVDAGETDPRKADTDGDGIPDGVEDANKNGVVDPGETDPKKADTDGDGLSDGVEDKNKNGVVDAGETDPRKADTDGGGVSDGVEEKAGGDPLDPSDDVMFVDTDGDGLADVLEKKLGTNPNSPDSDGDGIRDGDEVGPNVNAPIDTDGDGIIDALDPDDDNDGIPTRTEREDTARTRSSDDVDGDGKKNWHDTDADGDGVADGSEPGDSNRDGVPDYLQPSVRGTSGPNDADLAASLEGGGISCATSPGRPPASGGFSFIAIAIAAVVSAFARRRR